MEFKISWNSELMDTFFQGSQVSFHSDKANVYFRNKYISSGSSIVKWKSNLTYNINRSLMQLPLLKKNYLYRLNIDILIKPTDALLIKINFYDRSGRLLSSVPLKSNGGEFFYPNDAYSYEIEFINAGLEELIFTSLTLSDAKGVENKKYKLEFRIGGSL